MNYKSNALVICIVFLLIAFTTSAQKVFQVSLKFPMELNNNKVKIFYSNGKESKIVRGPFENNEVTISDSLYSKFATISCMYYTKDESTFSTSFFVADIPASIIINANTDTLANPFSEYKLINAYDISKTEEYKNFRLFMSFESNDYESFLKKFGNQISGNDSLNAILKVKYKNVLDKELDFVRQNGAQYYSLWIFKNELIPSKDFISADSLLKIFNAAFSQDLKNTYEGKQVESVLMGRINIADNDFAAYFKSVDIENKIVDLKNFKGKYVLLDFWASWCEPCIAELGTIKKLNDKYSKILTVISISTDRDRKPFMAAIKKNKMTWINIFHDINIENIFLKDTSIPQVFLIDPDGKRIYNNIEEKDYDLHKLKKILEKGI